MDSTAVSEADRSGATRMSATKGAKQSAPFDFSSPWLHSIASPGGRPMSLTDMGNSERLVLGHGDDLRFLHATRSWHVWDGCRFKHDDNGEARRRAKRTVHGMLLEAYALSDNEDQRKQLIAHQIRSESSRALDALLRLAESDVKIAARPADFDRNGLLLNLTNGTLDLQTGKLRAHERGDLITKLAPVRFDPTAKAPRWEAFLDEIMDGDSEKVSFLRRAIGYTLTGDVSEHVFFLLHGSGANGKSTFLETLRTLLGDYAMQSEFSTFLASRGTGVRNDIARLRGARLVTAVESDAGRRLGEGLVKHITGGDRVTARFLYSEHIEFDPVFKLWLGTNNKPRIFGTDEAIWRRIRLIPFTVTIPPDRRDGKLTDKLRSEASGILNWALAGLAEWNEIGLSEPKAIAAAGAEYRGGEDGLGRFLDDCVMLSPGDEVGAREMFHAYSQWVETAGEHRLRDKEFCESLEVRGFVRKRKSSGHFWLNVRLDSVGM